MSLIFLPEGENLSRILAAIAEVGVRTFASYAGLSYSCIYHIHKRGRVRAALVDKCLMACKLCSHDPTEVFSDTFVKQLRALCRAAAAATSKRPPRARKFDIDLPLRRRYEAYIKARRALFYEYKKTRKCMSALLQQNDA